MRKILGICFLFISSYSLSQENPERHYYCEAANLAMKNFEIIFMPTDRTFCEKNEDCTYLRRVKWKRAVAMNKTSLAAYKMMLLDPGYKKLSLDARMNCDQRHPQIEYPLPDSSECILFTCTLFF